MRRRSHFVASRLSRSSWGPDTRTPTSHPSFDYDRGTSSIEGLYLNKDLTAPGKKEGTPTTSTCQIKEGGLNFFFFQLCLLITVLDEGRKVVKSWVVSKDRSMNVHELSVRRRDREASIFYALNSKLSQVLKRNVGEFASQPSWGL